MNSSEAFAMGVANRGKEMMVFDWNKAATLIKEKGATYAAAGLESDWEYTGGSILENGQPVPRDETYVYLASTWATPQIEVDGELISCYLMHSNIPEDWEKDCDASSIYWPQSALDILNS